MSFYSISLCFLCSLPNKFQKMRNHKQVKLSVMLAVLHSSEILSVLAAAFTHLSLYSWRSLEHVITDSNDKRAGLMKYIFSCVCISCTLPCHYLALYSSEEVLHVLFCLRQVILTDYKTWVRLHKLLRIVLWVCS